MNIAARALVALAAISFFGGCAITLPDYRRTNEALAPSPRLIVGRVVAVDPARGYAFIELASDAPPSASAEGSELLVRTHDLKETARLRASRQLRVRTLGTHIASGTPAIGEEVIWVAPAVQ